jgi:hypothetical protein
MYNLGRIKRQLGKVVEAAELFQGSLALEEKQPRPSQERIGRRVASLALLFLDLKQVPEGLPYAERLLPLADFYQGSEKQTVATLFHLYAQELQKNGQSEVAARFVKKAEELRR